ncbi:hypothetical protein [Dactylosporangium sp. NPDC049140]|uniref:hypothetical protein n=1 Tax=Dactylosporangium sp. NPDC049140 TaxID=3155647 RepID=UPI0033F9A751
MANYDYWTAKEKLESGQPYTIESVATTWRNFAEAVRGASGHLQGTADDVTAQYGEPYQNFGDRAAPLAKWMTNVGGYADQVAGGLSKASTTGSNAQITMYEEDYSFSQDVDRILGPEDALSMGKVNAMNRREAQAAAVLNGEIEKWSTAYDAFKPGSLDAAPTRAGGGSDTGGSGSGSGSGGSNGAFIGSVSGGTTTTGNGSQVGSGTYPGSSVLGPDDGDFGGWVKDPRTGYLIDPATGQEFDPTTGRWIDPVTGKPFGDVEQYASRLEGLDGGNPSTGLLGGGNLSLTPPLAGGGGGGGTTGLAGMYGGLVPPSLDPNNPASNQLRQQAADRMAAKAYAAEQLALKEASQGGRPFVPPMSAGGQTGGLDGRRSSVRKSLVTEPESTWTSRARATARSGGGSAQEEALLNGRAGRLGRAGGGRGMGGVAEELTYPGSGATAAAGGRTGGAVRGRAGRLPGEPLEAAGGRAGGAAGQGGRGAYLPPTQAGHGDEHKDKQRKRPEWLVEDDVWSANLDQAGPRVLGED